MSYFWILPPLGFVFVILADHIEFDVWVYGNSHRVRIRETVFVEQGVDVVGLG